MNRKGWTWSSPKSVISLFAGILLGVLGAAPLLWNYIEIPYLSFIPNYVFHHMVIKIALVVGGLFLLYDSFNIVSAYTYKKRTIAIVGGLILAILGAIPLLLEFGLMGFIPWGDFASGFELPLWGLRGLLIFFGLYLVYDAFEMQSAY